MTRKVYRGELYFADLNPVVGSEQGGHRPVLIIQNNIGIFTALRLLLQRYRDRYPQKQICQHIIL